MCADLAAKEPGLAVQLLPSLSLSPAADLRSDPEPTGFDPECCDSFCLVAKATEMTGTDEWGGKWGTKRRNFGTNFPIFSRRKTRIVIYYENRL